MHEHVDLGVRINGGVEGEDLQEQTDGQACTVVEFCLGTAMNDDGCIRDIFGDGR